MEEQIPQDIESNLTCDCCTKYTTASFLVILIIASTTGLLFYLALLALILTKLSVMLQAVVFIPYVLGLMLIIIFIALLCTMLYSIFN